MKSIILIRHGQSEYQSQRIDQRMDGYRTSITALRVNEWNEHTIERLNDTAHLYEAGLAEGINVST